MAATGGSQESPAQNPAYAPTRHHTHSDLRFLTEAARDQGTGMTITATTARAASWSVGVGSGLAADEIDQVP